MRGCVGIDGDRTGMLPNSTPEVIVASYGSWQNHNSRSPLATLQPYHLLQLCNWLAPLLTIGRRAAKQQLGTSWEGWRRDSQTSLENSEWPLGVASEVWPALGSLRQWLSLWWHDWCSETKFQPPVENLMAIPISALEQRERTSH